MPQHSRTRPEPEGGRLALRGGDALVVVDVQRDFLPGGALGVPDGDAVVPVLNRCMELFLRVNLPIVLSRDWHPADHCSFRAQGGPWPPHCIAASPGAAFAPGLAVPEHAHIVSKATTAVADAYSAFQRTGLGERLRSLGCGRLFIGGLATDYCVLATVRDAIGEGFDVVVLRDAMRAVNVHPGDGARAEHDMTEAGAQLVTSKQLVGGGA
ncbi:isochorismatase family protein [Thauera sp. 2A1]|uniref:isochorismatase family protein n=1 Tax=Thauera sp. 2A1 TaxID=2570191 RepID=UPI001291EB4E|nr:isochorismatase family protein [Thauera sp. 2A1]KAI5916410.1 isochorismatase family protein [Thauera sp. 2A1]